MVKKSKSAFVPRVRISIKAYVGLWVSSIIACCLVLVAGWLIADAKRDQMVKRIFADANALDAGRLLEITLLSERREDLNWRLTRDEVHRDRRDADLRKAQEMARGLNVHAISPEERLIVEEIGKKLEAFRAELAAETPVSIEGLRRMADDALGAVDRYLARNDSDMEGTIHAAQQLTASVSRWSMGVLAFVGAVLVLGAWGLINRVIRPTFDLTRAASRFGKGDFAARGRVMRDDELGTLCRTFNNMAEEVANNEKTRLDFVASVAHDLKNPLVTIGGAARIIRNRSLEPTQQIEWLDRIIGQVARLENLTLDLMDTVQVATGRLSLNKVNFDLMALLRDLQREQAEILSSHTLLFEGEEECRILGDKSRLERVAMNLISNAVKYSPEGTSIVLKVERRESGAVFTVKDQGAGMSQEDLKIAFQPFGRGGIARHMAKGTGLGLCIVREIVEAHGGNINLQSELGVGTVVEVCLPLAGS